jgi:MOSC domain-containing protein YiiM
MAAAMNTSARIVSIQVGLPRTIEDQHAVESKQRQWTTGFFKEAVAGPVYFHQTHIEGDGQADRANHGGFDKGVLGYSADHYVLWHSELGIADLAYGGFGENLTVAGLTEHTVCVGDLWQLGDVGLEISQPRQPCWKIGRRWGLPDLPKRVVRTGRTGWYFRVVQEGLAAAGALRLLDRPNAEWTVAQCNTIFYSGSDRARLAALARLPQLAEAWKEDIRKKLHYGARSTNARW